MQTKNKRLFDVLHLPKFNQNKQNKRKRIAAMIMAAILAVTIPVAANADFVEWDDEAKEMAWTVYTTTQWSDLGLIYATTDGSIAMADVPDDFRNTYGPIIDELFTDNTVSTAYPPADYKELLLAIIYTLNQEGNSLFSQEEIDICYWHKYMNNGTFKPNTVENSISLVMNRLFSYSNLYSNYHDEVVDIFTNDEKLGVLVQSIIYTSGYIRENETYSPENAKAYAEANPDSVADEAEGWETFANDVLSRYSAITSNAHTTVG